MSNEVRRQATLYLADPIAGQIEWIRKRFNRVQFELIAAHVTLCRDDEVTGWAVLGERLKGLSELAVSLEFGRPVREGNSVLLPVRSDTQCFDDLRVTLLQDARCRQQYAHITLVHPRNGTCLDSDFHEIQLAADEIFQGRETLRIAFPTVTLIEKIGELPWRNVASGKLDLANPQDGIAG